MEERPEALLLKYPGTNCDGETARALRLVGFEPRVVPITRVKAKDLERVRLAVFSGGFSYGDYVMAGRLAQLETVRRLGDALKDFVSAGGHVLGICNGFQILVKLGLLPEGSLIDNKSRRFQCQWVGLRKSGKASPYLKNLPDEFELPIAHAEGRFVASEERIEKYLKRGYVVLRYADDVNGSSAKIAGIQDATHRVLGLMPHPERFIYTEHHYDPDWIRREGAREWGWGYYLFESIYESVMERANAPAG